MDTVQIIIKLALPTVYTLLLVGCAHGVEPIDPSQEQINIIESQVPALWHDGSIGGVFGIGEGWSIELLPVEFETVTESFTTNPPAGGIELIAIPAEYEWVEDNSEDLSRDPIMVSKLVTLPAEYETVIETIIVKPEHTTYYLTEAKYSADGSIKTPRTVKQQHMPATTRQEERRVVKLPERTVERIVPLERRKGYRRIVKTPARTMEDTSLFFGPYYTTRVAEAQPWRFLIKRPNGGIVHVFDDYEDLSTFIDSLK